MKGETTGEFLKYFIRRYPKKAISSTLLLVIASSFEGLSVVALFPLFAGLGGDAVGAESGIGRAIESLLGVVGIEATTVSLLGLVVFGIVVKGLLVWFAMRQVGMVVAHVVTDLRVRLMHNLFRVRWGFFTKKPMGALANAVSAEVELAGAAFNQVIALGARCLQIAVYAVVILILSWHALLFAVVATSVIVLVLSRLVRFNRMIGRRQADIMRSYVATLLDTVHGVKPIRAMAREAAFEAHLKKEAEELRGTMQLRVSASEALLAAQEPLLAVIIAIGFGIAVTHFNYDFSSLVVLGFLFWRIVGQSNRVVAYYNRLVQLEPYFWGVERIISETDAQQEQWPGTDPLPDETLDIEFKDVAFSYNDVNVLSDLNILIPHGKLTVLAGPSGAGKTTIVDLLMGFIKPDKGQILVGSTPLEDIALTDWRRCLGYVPQEMILIHDSVYQNVALGDESVDEAAVRRALEDAEAWDFVAQLDKGVHTSVGERGSLLSGGQRQRTAIARALIGQPKLLILDEVTTALDPANEQSIIETLLRLKGNTTILAITHQRALIEAADVVYRIVERPRAQTLH